MQNKKLRASYEELQNTVGSLQHGIQALYRQVAENAEVLAGVVSLLGEETVQREVNRLRDERKQAAEEAQEANVKKLVDAKVLIPVEATTVDGYVVGIDQRGDQTMRTQFEIAVVPEQERPKYVGLKAGDVVTGNGGQFKVTECYAIDKAAAVEFAKARAKAAAPAPEAPAPEQKAE